MEKRSKRFERERNFSGWSRIFKEVAVLQNKFYEFFFINEMYSASVYQVTSSALD